MAAVQAIWGPVHGVSMVLPAYNEEQNIGRALKNADRALASTGLDYELIVVNDGSDDHTGGILRRLRARYPHLRVVEHYPSRGYGGALRAGLAEARYDWIVQSDADNQFDLAELPRLVKLARGIDLVVGYRKPRRDPWIRRMNGWGWNLLIRLLFGYVVHDVDCAFRLIRRASLVRLPLSSNGAMIPTELLAGARARGFAIAETRVAHLPRDGAQATGANPRVIVRAFRDLVRYRTELWRQLRAERAQALAPASRRGPCVGWPRSGGAPGNGSCDTCASYC